MFGAHAIEHGSSRTGRWLRERRFRFTLWIAAVEGLLYLFHALHWWAAVALAVIAVGFWWYVARGNRSDTLREAGGSSPSRSCSFSACRSRSRL